MVSGGLEELGFFEILSEENSASDQEVIDRFEQVLMRFSVKASLLPQRPLASFIKDGEFYRHIRRVRRVYGERRRFFLEALTSRLGQFGSYEDHLAGMQIAFRLPVDTDDLKIQRQANEIGVTAQALSAFYAKAPTGKGLLLGFCGFTEEELDKGLAQLVPILEH